MKSTNALENYKGTRKVVTRSKMTHRYLVISPKNKRTVECESGLERDFALLLEYSRNVRSYYEQPRKFRIPALKSEVLL